MLMSLCCLQAYEQHVTECRSVASSHLHARTDRQQCWTITGVVSVPRQSHVLETHPYSATSALQSTTSSYQARPTTRG